MFRLVVWSRSNCSNTSGWKLLSNMTIASSGIGQQQMVWLIPKRQRVHYLRLQQSRKNEGISCCPFRHLGRRNCPLNRTNRFDTLWSIYTMHPKVCVRAQDPRHTPAAYNIHIRRRHLCICLWLRFEFPTFKCPKTKRTVSLFHNVVLHPSAPSSTENIAAVFGRSICKDTNNSVILL